MASQMETPAAHGGGIGLLRGTWPRAAFDDEPTVVIRGSPLCDQVHAALFDSLTSGRLRPGDRVVEREWAERLTVSRTPVRQAIQRLAQEGLLEPLRSGGYAVSRPGIEDVVHIYEFRAVVERYTAEAAAGRTRVSVLGHNLEAARTALAHRDIERAMAAGADFHRLIADACGQRHFARAVDTSLRWTAFYQRAMWEAIGGTAQAERQALRHVERSVDDHQTIAGRLAAGDAAGAGEAMADHLRALAAQVPHQRATVAGATTV